MKSTVMILALLMASVGMQITILCRGSFGPVFSTPNNPVRVAPEGSIIELTGRELKGSSSAPIAIVEFSDYECPFCRQHAGGVSHDIEREYIATGKVRYAIFNNPLPSHKNASLLAVAALCAGQQERFWEMNDALFKAPSLNKNELYKLIVDIDQHKFETCLEIERRVLCDD